MIRGLGGNLSLVDRTAFAKEVSGSNLVGVALTLPARVDANGGYYRSW